MADDPRARRRHQGGSSLERCYAMRFHLRAARRLLPELLLLLAILPLLLLTLRLILRATLPLVRSLAIRSLGGTGSAIRTRSGVRCGIGRSRRRSAAGVHMLRARQRNPEACAQQQRKHTSGELESSAHATLHLLIRLTLTRIILLLL